MSQSKWNLSKVYYFTWFEVVVFAHNNIKDWLIWYYIELDEISEVIILNIELDEINIILILITLSEWVWSHLGDIFNFGFIGEGIILN